MDPTLVVTAIADAVLRLFLPLERFDDRARVNIADDGEIFGSRCNFVVSVSVVGREERSVLSVFVLCCFCFLFGQLGWLVLVLRRRGKLLDRRHRRCEPEVEETVSFSFLKNSTDAYSHGKGKKIIKRNKQNNLPLFGTQQAKSHTRRRPKSRTR